MFVEKWQNSRELGLEMAEEFGVGKGLNYQRPKIYNMNKIKLSITLFLKNLKIQIANCWTKKIYYCLYLSLKVINTHTVIKGIIKET